MLDNGTVINGTSCTSPIEGIEVRGGLGIAFAVLFGAVLPLCLVQLKKHGASHLPVEKQFRLVSRRWPWYWANFTAAVGIISGFMAIDVDREYIPGIAIILQNFFYYLMLPTALAAVWEMTRHWGSFQERKILDDDPFHFPTEDRRSKIEFYLPLVFYLWAFLTFFLSNLRSWTPISKQSINDATDARFQASSVFALVAWIVIVASALVTNHYYRVRVPWKISASIGLLLVRIAYGLACAFDGWEYSPLRITTSPGYIYGLGYLPILLVLLVMVIGSWRELNEDRALIALRRDRELKADMAMRSLQRDSYNDHKVRKELSNDSSQYQSSDRA